MGATVFEIAGGRTTPSLPPSLVKGVLTIRLGKGRVKDAKQDATRSLPRYLLATTYMHVVSYVATTLECKL